MDTDGLKADLESLLARVVTLEQELAESQRRAARLARTRRHKQRMQAKLFFTLNAAAEAMGLPRDVVRRMVQLGSLRVIRFPDGKPRVPRSELQRIDTFGFDYELPPRRPTEEPAETEQTPALPRTAAG
jgi:excisionase family DNA binding protein